MSILRIEPVRAGRDDAPYECVAENGVADAVSAEATLSVYESEFHFNIYSFIDQQTQIGIGSLKLYLPEKG